MKIKLLMIDLIVLGLAVSAQAGYGDLKDAYESYKPTPYYESQLRTAEKPITSAPDDSFKQDMEILNAKRFQESQKDKGRIVQEVIGDLDSELMSVLDPSATDSFAAAAFLRESYDLKTLITMVILRNPSITAAEKNYRAAIEKISQVTELDTILRQYSAFTEGVMTGVGPMKGKDPVNMKFPFPGVTALKAQVAQQEIKIARLELEKSIRNAVSATKKSYWNLLYVKQARAITQEIMILLTHLEGVATTRYEAGRTSYQDVIKIRINKETLKERLVTLEEREKNLEVSILAGLNLPAESVMGIPERQIMEAPVPDINFIYVQAQNHRQEIRQIRAIIGKMERMLEMAETMILPPFSLNLSLYQDEAVMRVGTFNKMGTFPQTTAASRGAGLPKNSWYGTNDAYLRQIRQNIEALKAKSKSVEDNTIRLVRKVWFDLDQAKREESLYARTIVDLAQTSLEVSTQGYESGKVMFADVFASYDLWFKARLALERKRSDVGVTWAELEKSVGKHLN
jgi:outer membrane protein TolC